MKVIQQNSKPTTSSIILNNLLAELGYSDIKDYQSRNGLKVDGQFGDKSFNLLYHTLLKVIDVSFEGSYHKSIHQKNQIIWHHSAGWDNARGMFKSWQNDNKEHVATAIGINDKGEVYRGFDEQYWASSIGCKQDSFNNWDIKPIKVTIDGRVYTNNSLLDAGAVGVEVCNAGQLTKKAGDYYSWFGWKVPSDKVIELDYKGYTAFEKYTNEEINTLKYWTLLMGVKFNIPVNYRDEDMWKVSRRALSGETGLYTHNSYREDKTDVSPQPHLIEMARTLDLYMQPKMIT